MDMKTELQVMKNVDNQLKRLDAPARDRVINYFTQKRYDESLKNAKRAVIGGLANNHPEKPHLADEDGSEFRFRSH